VGVSTYLVRVIGRRSVARTTAKVLAAFIIVPVIVFWDALLAYSLTYNSAILVLGRVGTPGFQIGYVVF
jgi:hypothetical protein